jgi:hypothetical protein
MAMAEKVTWIVFRAHPSGFTPEDDFHPDFFGTFVCPVSRPEPELLLKEVLGNQKLALIDIGSTQLKSKADPWGMNERLKRPLDEQGFGISLVKVQAPSGQTD